MGKQEQNITSPTHYDLLLFTRDVELNKENEIMLLGHNLGDEKIILS